MAELPDSRYLNWYGPTETNVCTAFEVPAGGADARPAPIGKACANTEVYAVTSDGRRVSQPGEIGELYVRGPSLMRGYWGQPAKTGEALVANPFRAESGELVYRTGDLVTLEPDGNYAYLGRRDSMVKIRGYRVELGEVEAVLYRHPAIREAAVLPVPDELLGSRLRAVVAADGAGNLTRENVLDHCRQWLPGYMVPDIVEFREALPRTSTGKVDRAGLAREQHELEPAGDGRGTSARPVCAVPSDAVAQGGAPGGAPRRQRSHLLQVRGCQPHREPQAQHRPGAGPLLRPRRREAHRHGHGSGPVGDRSRLRLPGNEP